MPENTVQLFGNRFWAIDAREWISPNMMYVPIQEAADSSTPQALILHWLFPNQLGVRISTLFKAHNLEAIGT